MQTRVDKEKREVVIDDAPIYRGRTPIKNRYIHPDNKLPQMGVTETLRHYMLSGDVERAEKLFTQATEHLTDVSPKTLRRWEKIMTGDIL